MSLWICREIKSNRYRNRKKKPLGVILSLGTAISLWKSYQLFERDACCKHIESSFPERLQHFSLKPNKIFLVCFISLGPDALCHCECSAKFMNELYPANSSAGNSARSLQSVWHMKRPTQFIQYSQYSIQFLWITSYSVLCYFKCLWWVSSKALAWNRTTETLCRISSRKKDTKFLAFFYV